MAVLQKPESRLATRNLQLATTPATDNSQLLLSVAHAHHTAGRTAEAEGLYQQVLIAQPNHAGALNRLGVLLLQTGRADAAVVRLRRASEIDPSSAMVLSNLGAALRQTSDFDGALNVLQQAVKLDPTLAMAHMNLASALLDLNQPSEALVAIEKSLSLDPQSADAHNNRGNALKALARWDEAIETYHIALSLSPELAAAHSNLGVALMEMNDLPTAIAHYRKAIELDPNYAEAFGNLANALAASGDLEAALLAAAHGVNLSPNNVHGHWNLAVVLLSRGDYIAGWDEYEWRFRSRGDSTLSRFIMPRWDGQDLTDKTIILHAEQGFGDAIQFVRYVPMVAELGGRVILECHPELVTLFETVDGAAQVIARGEPLPFADYQCPLMSLGRVFGTTLLSIPADGPYLFLAKPGSSEYLRDRRAERLKIGFVWAGNPKHSNDARRSVPFEMLAPILQMEAEFISLQRDEHDISETEPGHPRPGLTNTGPRTARLCSTAANGDFLQTAKVVASLDLIITVDTAVAHLAGALGVETWIMLPARPDWRWLTDRTDSPWYPTARLFRQTVRDDWTDVIARVSATLAERVATC